MPANLIEAEALAYAREACARSVEVRGHPDTANSFRVGSYDDIPDIHLRVAAYLAGYTAALSPQPTISTVVETTEEAAIAHARRLDAEEGPTSENDAAFTDAVLTNKLLRKDGGDPFAGYADKLVNPDGPEAATRIATLGAENARLREALTEIGREQSAKTAHVAADRFQAIARAALGETK